MKLSKWSIFYAGAGAAVGIRCSIQDLVGQEAYIQYTVDNWIKMSPFWGLGCAAFCIWAVAASKRR